MLISTREVAKAQERLEAALVDLTDDDMREDSGCPGWTRGHVLTHVARNGEGMANLARWALDREVVPMYASGRRDAEIEEGAGRGADDLRADVAATNVLALDALGELEGAVATDPLVAERVVRLGDDPEQGTPVHARRLPLLRLQEVVLHHHDLDLGMRPGDWPEDMVAASLAWVWPRMAARLDDPPRLRRTDAGGGFLVGRPDDHGASTVEVVGTGADLLAWITGRADGDTLAGLEVRGGAELPAIPDF